MAEPSENIINNLEEDHVNNTYMFSNRKINLQVYVDADGWQEAEQKFHACQFQNPSDWEIYLKVRNRSN
tara:strand:- start:1751 stop:1957 length:207 start_codon:yes stop_codon:yes gene_type:complete